jgi:hypothetical protein
LTCYVAFLYHPYKMIQNKLTNNQSDTLTAADDAACDRILHKGDTMDKGTVRLMEIRISTGTTRYGEKPLGDVINLPGVSYTALKQVRVQNFDAKQTSWILIRSSKTHSLYAGL